MDLRPRIYVYDLPPQFNVRLLQYRGGKRVCTHRQAFPEMFVDSDYGAETALHEALLGSPYRTHDPETADFFFVPVYLACYLHPVRRVRVGVRVRVRVRARVGVLVRARVRVRVRVRAKARAKARLRLGFWLGLWLG